MDTGHSAEFQREFAAAARQLASMEPGYRRASLLPEVETVKMAAFRGCLVDDTMATLKYLDALSDVEVKALAKQASVLEQLATGLLAARVDCGVSPVPAT